MQTSSLIYVNKDILKVRNANDMQHPFMHFTKPFRISTMESPLRTQFDLVLPRRYPRFSPYLFSPVFILKGKTGKVPVYVKHTEGAFSVVIYSL